MCAHFFQRPRTPVLYFSLQGCYFSSDKLTLEPFLPEDICFQWVCQVRHLILSLRHEGLKSIGVRLEGLGLSHVSRQLLMIRALFKTLRITTVCCLLAAEWVLICGDYPGSMADGFKRKAAFKKTDAAKLKFAIKNVF